MQTIAVQNREIPRIGLGTYRLEGDACRSVVAEALELGYRHIDTAEAYGNEDAIGRAVDESGLSRDDIFLTTKIWRDNLDADAVSLHLEQSLDRLRTDHVDMLLIHWPHPEIPLDEPLTALQELQSNGRAHLIGVSNFTPALVEKAVALAPIACNQVEYHPFLAQDELLALARDHGHVLTAYAPIARNEVGDDPVLHDIGQVHGKTPAQISLRWLIEQPNVVAIPRSSSREHLAQNLDVFDFELDDAQKRRIDDLDRGLRLIDPAFAPDW